MEETLGWCEPGIKTICLQLVRKLPVHSGPGYPVTITPTTTPITTTMSTSTTTTTPNTPPTTTPSLVWVIQWTVRTLHQGPSGRVTGVAMASTRGYLATTTHHRYLQVTALLQPDAEEGTEEEKEDVGTRHVRSVRVPTCLAKAKVEGLPRCVLWATCQVTGEEDIVVVGQEDGSLNMFVLHVVPKTGKEQLTLVQVERPHETPILHINTSKKTKPNGGATSFLVTVGEDRRIFIFRLIRVAKLTKLDPVGYYQLESVPTRIEVQGIPAITTASTATTTPTITPTSITSARAAPDSWLLQRYSGPKESWDGVKVVHQQLLEEVANACCYDNDHSTLVLAVPTPDGETMVGVTSVGCVVHIHQSQEAYSVRVCSKRLGGSRTSEQTMHGTTKVQDITKCSGLDARPESSVVGPDAEACVSEDGAWAAVWVAGGDLFLYRARGDSFPLPQKTQMHLRHLVVVGSSRELERLEVLLGKLRTLYSWNPLVSVPSIQFLSSGEVLTAVDTSEEVFTLLSRLAQIRQGRETGDGVADEGDTLQSYAVLQVRDLLNDWLNSIRAGRGPPAAREEPSVRSGSVKGDLVKREGPTEDYKNQVGSGLTPRPTNTTHRSTSSCEGPEGDTSEEGEERDSVAALQAHVREVVTRVGSAGRGGGADLTPEADLDMGRNLKWRRMALTRLKEYRARELARSAQLAAYKTEHSIPLQEEGEEGEGGQGEDERDQDINDEITVPPTSVTVAQVEAQLWHLLGKVELEGSQVKVRVEEAAAAQENILQQVNQHRAEWGHSPLTLTHLPHHLNVQVSDELVNEFYCDSLDLEDNEDVLSPGDGLRRGPGGSTSRRAKTSPGTVTPGRRAKASPGAATPGRRRPDTKKDSEGTDVPPLSLSGSPRTAKISRTPRTTRDIRTARTTTTTTTRTYTTPRTTKTHRSGRGRRSVRETPKPPPAPRPPLSLEQVQHIQCARTTYLTSLTQVIEPLQPLALEVEEALSKCEQYVVGERGRLAWAILRAGQLVRAVGVRVRYKDSEKNLRAALKERIREQQLVKEKVLGLRQRIEEYEREQECLAHLEEEVDHAFAHLVTDNAQFEVQLTRYFESSTTSGVSRPESVSGSGESEGDVGDSGDDDDSGLGTDEARTEGAGPRPAGCDPAVFSLVTVLRELRWRVAGAVERSRRERALEERRHAAEEREAELGVIPSVVWLRRSQTSGDLTSGTHLPIPNTEVDSMAAVKWPSERSSSAATLLSRDHLQLLEQRVAQAKVAQELAARRRREGRAERRALTQQVEQLKEELHNLRQTYQVTKACKLGMGAEVDMGIVQDKLGTSLDLRWPGKVASQMTRHDTTMNQLQADINGRTRELRALQKEEAALAAHILALRQEKDHLLYHLAQTSSRSTPLRQQKKGEHTSLGKTRQVGGSEELQLLKATVMRQDDTIAALRHEISTLRSKTASVVLPGQSSLPSAKLHHTGSPFTPPSNRAEAPHSQRQLTYSETTLFEKNHHPLPDKNLSETTADKNVLNPGVHDYDEAITESRDDDCSGSSTSSDVSDS
ncbi:hypothetical protein Hamer_G014732 [Homarus americanus]|uniref:Uncharacterized protein n=1 Tax=Homarus americanus TaxID=6706 RepID=A0A8J5N1N5_HOMAM|nr:hypothetical protein Hamer_G014732 [Homarus americanus]